MPTQKLTLSVNPETIKQFKTIAFKQGYSISAWVNAKMQEEIDTYSDLKTVVKILRKEYAGLTKNINDDQILNDIVTIFMARSFNRPTLKKMYHDLDSLE